MKIITRVTLPLTITALAITGCSSDTPAPEPTPTQSSATTATPTKTPAATHAPENPTSAPEAAPTQASAQPFQSGLDTTSGVAWYTDKEDPALLSQYGLIADIYYPRMSDRDTMCAQSQPFVCTTPAERVAFMDASIDQFQDDYAAENPGTGSDMDAAPLRENDPYADLTDEELAELPVTGMP